MAFNGNFLARKRADDARSLCPPCPSCSTAIAKRVRLAVQASDHFELLSKEVGVPLVAFRLRPVVGADGWTQDRLYDEFQVDPGVAFLMSDH